MNTNIIIQEHPGRLEIMPSDLSQKEYIIYMNKIEIFQKIYLLLWFNLADTLGDDNQITSTTHSMSEVTARRSSCINCLSLPPYLEQGFVARVWHFNNL